MDTPRDSSASGATEPAAQAQAELAAPPLDPAAQDARIRDVLSSTWGLPSAKQWQVDAIRVLWLYDDPRVLLVRRTGDGKSAVVFGAATLLGGISLLVVPLIGLGVDLTARVDARRKTQADGPV